MMYRMILQNRIYIILLLSVIFTVSEIYAQGTDGIIIRLPEARVGQPFAYAVSLQGMIEPVRYEWNGEIPDWLQINGSLLQGIPSPDTNSNILISLRVTDSLDNALEVTYELQVKPVLLPLELLTTSVPDFVIGSEVSFVFAARGGEGVHHWERVNAILPRGLELEINEDAGTCILRGTAEEVGGISLDIIVRDADTQIGPAHYESNVVPSPPPPINCLVPPNLTVTYQTRFEIFLAASGGYAPYQWSLNWNDTTSPDWLEFDSTRGILSGLPTRMETCHFSVLVIDNGGNQSSCEVELEVVHPAGSEPLQLVSTTLPNAIVGRPYEALFVVQNPRGHIEWDLNWDDAPDWLETEFQGHVIRFKGSVTAIGEWNFSLSARDLDNVDAAEPHVFGEEEWENITIRSIEENPMLAAPPPFINTSSIPLLYANEPFSMQLAATGGWGALEFISVIPETQSTWLTISNTGLLSTENPSEGSFEIVVEARDERGQTSVPATLEVRVLDQRNIPLEVMTFSNPKVIAGELFRFCFPARGGTGKVSFYSKRPLYSGLQVNNTSGVLTGIIREIGEYPITFIVQDSANPPHKIEKEFIVAVMEDTNKLNENWSTANILGALFIPVLILWILTFRGYLNYRKRFNALALYIVKADGSQQKNK